MTFEKVYYEIQPSPILQSVVKCFWFYNGIDIIKNNSKNNLVIPDNSMDIILDFSSPHKSNSFLTGMMTKPILSNHKQLFGIRFYPHVNKSILQTPLKEYTDLKIDLDDIKSLKSKFATIFSQSFQSIDLKLIESILLKLIDEDQISERITHAIKTIENSPNVSILGLAEHLNMSRQFLNRIFQDYIGISGKQFQKVHRIQGVVQNCDTQSNWADVALSFGYFDQAHFIKDFKNTTGQTPTQYFAN